jgi:cytochrome c oxidase cbb3-type subunit III
MELSTRCNLVIALALCALPALAQQHGYTTGDIEEGGKLYRANCIGCHGPEGASVTGIDLGRARFRRVTTDEEIVDVILKGVPGTGMPGGIITAAQRAYFVVAYMRTMNENSGVKSIAAAKGDAIRGKALFTGKGTCNNCHRAYGVGGRSGPDLSEAGLTLRPIEIETSMLDPDKDMSAATQPYRAVKKDGVTVTGALLNQDTHTLQILDASGRLASIAKTDLRESGFVTKSPMPSYRGKLNPQELADLIAYVASLKGAAQ